MQEINLNIAIHDILSDDEPPKSGWYFIVQIDPNRRAELTPYWWDSEYRAWRVCEDYPNIEEPSKYWGRNWTEDKITSVLRGG